MDFGCCVNLLATPDDPVGLQWLERVVAVGFDYVELPVAEMMLLDDTAFADLVHRLKALELRCMSCNNFFPQHLRLTGSDRREHQIRDYLADALPRIGALGAQTIVFGSAGAKNVPAGFPMTVAWEQVAEDLQVISDAIAATLPNVRIAIEPVCKRESNILLNYAESVSMAEKVKRANVLCLVDYYHMRVEEEALDDLHKGGTLLRHVHISCPNGRTYPFEDDGEDYAAFFDVLRRIDYKGNISVEGFTNDFEKDARAALALLRKFS